MRGALHDVLRDLAYGGGSQPSDPITELSELLRTVEPESYRDVTDPIAELFARHADAAIAVALHQIGASERQVTRHSRSGLVFRELEKRLAPEFWRRANIDLARVQRPEMAAAIAREVRDAEDKLAGVLRKRPSFAGLDQLHAELNRTFKDPRVIALTGPYSSWRREEADCRTLLQNASRLFAEPSLERFEQWSRKFRELAERLRGTGDLLDEQLCDLLASIGTALTALIDEHGLRDAADLRVAAVLRRLPLDLPGHRFRLPLIIENSGRGVATSPRLRIEISGRAEFDQQTLSLGDSLDRGAIRIELEGVIKVDQPGYQRGTADECMLNLSWLDWKGEECIVEQIIVIEPQRSGIDWSQLEAQNPYGLEPVENPGDLFGRERLVNQLLSTFRTPEVGSAFVLGQKRVGKTSLALAALRRMREDFGVVTMFRDSGSINNPDPAITVDNLVARWIKGLKVEIPSLSILPDPPPSGALSSLQNFLEDALGIKPDLRVILALDEFDRLPGDLLRRTSAGDAFFSTLRSITSLRGVGLLLIGGEGMKLVLTGPGGDLNKPTTVQVDTIDRERHWSDFVQLVRAPAAGLIDISDAAVDAVYRWSHGNPYFAKNLLQRVYATAVAMRHDEVMEDEVDAAVHELVSPDGNLALSANSFAHYWEDYLLERGEEADAITLNRRRALLAFAAVSRSGGEAITETLAEAGIAIGLDPGRCGAEMEQFRQRGIFERSGSGVWSARLPIFQRWLVERGAVDITMNVTELHSEAMIAQRERELVPNYEEVRDWCRTCQIVYRASALTADRLVSYLRQFGGGKEQRAVFNLVKRVHFIAPVDVASTCGSLHQLVLGALKKQGQWSREQILLTSLDGLGKSQQAIARDYCEAAGLAVRFNLVSPEVLAARVAENKAKAVVVVDDFAGSGQSLSESLARLVDEVPDVGTLPLFVFAIAGFDTARSRIEDSGVELGLDQLCVRFGVEFGSSDRALAIEAFESDADRAFTADLVFKWGEALEPKHAVGYGAAQGLVVLDRTVPNNSLPILWKSTKDFEPLFPRARK